LLGKLSDIQDKMFVDNFVPCDTFELEYISLRGAIGIKDGTGKDEIEVDFTKFDRGVVALIGKNGAGKTTLIENCHPYPQMLTRSGALKDHFCLHKSHRILVYRSSQGKRIRITMLIDGTSKCIMTKYYVEIQEAGETSFVPYKNCDGSYNAYMAFVESTFGPIEVFLRTSFYAKEQIKSIPDLSKATRSEKVSLFSLLAGIDYLSFVSDCAKENAKIEQDKIDELSAKIDSFGKLEKQVSDFSEKELSAKNTVAECEQLLAEKEPLLQELKKEQRKFEAFINTFEDKRLEVADLSREILDLEKEQTEIQSERSEILEKLKNKTVYKQQYDWYEENTELRVNLQKNVSEKLSEKLSLQKDIESLEKESKKVKNELSSLTLKKVSVTTKLEGIEIPDVTDVCYACGQKLSDDKIQEQIKRNEALNNEKTRLQSELEDIAENETELSKQDECNTVAIEKLKVKDSDLTSETLEIQKDINQIDTYMESINIDEIKQVLFSSETTLNNLNSKLEKIQKSISEKNAKIESYQSELNDMPESKEDEIFDLEDEISITQSKKDTANAVINFITEQRKEYKEMFNQLDNFKEEITQRKKHCHDYKVISKAFGIDGIQICELESAIPEIEEVTNNILSESYDDRFEVSFETQRDSKDGRRIEDFVISVFDGASGRVKKLDLLCSGESVWIKQAMYYAFSIVRSRRTGFSFKTRFLDEADGSLDSNARGKYLRMIEAAHGLCGANLTILITHSQEIKDVVSQKIEL